MQTTRPRYRRPSAQPFIFLFAATVCLALVALTPQGQPSKPACASNLRQIDGAKEQWALENRAPAGTQVGLGQIAPFIKGGELRCPSGGVYTIGRIDEAPRCTIREHILNPAPAPISTVRKLFTVLAVVSALLTVLAFRSLRHRLTNFAAANGPSKSARDATTGLAP
jgi:hypothetical protein